jgi:hypothetical protein
MASHKPKHQRDKGPLEPRAHHMAETEAKRVLDQAVHDWLHEGGEVPEIGLYQKTYDKAYQQILAELNGLIPS